LHVMSGNFSAKTASTDGAGGQVCDRAPVPVNHANPGPPGNTRAMIGFIPHFAPLKTTGSRTVGRAGPENLISSALVPVDQMANGVM